MINQERLWDHLMKLGQVGKTETRGVTRLSFTKEEQEAKNLVSTFMRKAGLEVHEDAVGNLIGRKAGRNPYAPVVLIGGHIDTVRNGGKFDGTLGVLAGIEVLQTMNEQGIVMEHPIEVIAFTDEEGTRFGISMIGSRGIAGLLTYEDLQNHKDKKGVTIAEAMQESGLNPKEIDKVGRTKGSVKAYIELHIEQGIVLRSHHVPIGIVNAIAERILLEVTISGTQGHAAEPMKLRHDPLAAAAEIILVIEKEAKKNGTAVGTVGEIDAVPEGTNIIPKSVKFFADLRDINVTALNNAVWGIFEQSKKISRERGVQLNIKLLDRLSLVPVSKKIQEIEKRAAVLLGLPPLTLPSYPGHDAVQLAKICPVGMIFVRSNGISHAPEEFASKEDCAVGANVLYKTLLQLAKT